MSEPTPFTTAPGADPVHPRPPTRAESESQPEEPKSDLRGRFITAGVLVALAISTVVAGGLWFLGIMMALILLGQREFYRMIEDKGAHPLVGFGLTAGAALTLIQYFGNDYQANLLMTATLLVVLVGQLGKAAITEALASVSGTFFGVFYVGWLLSHAISLRNFHRVVSNRYDSATVTSLEIAPECGIFLLFFTLTIVIWCDAGAYFGGRAYGKHKLAPAISPKKTIEGAVVGLFSGLLGAVVCKGVFEIFWPALAAPVSWSAVVVLALLLSVAGIVGDLIESLLKRDAQVKDTGSLFPGHGGVLDRMDSLLLAIPVMYYSMLFYIFMQVG